MLNTFLSMIVWLLLSFLVSFIATIVMADSFYSREIKNPFKYVLPHMYTIGVLLDRKVTYHECA